MIYAVKQYQATMKKTKIQPVVNELISGNNK